MLLVRIVVPAVLLAFLAGCDGSQTAYKAVGGRFPRGVGYQEMALAPGFWRVTYQVMPNTDMELGQMNWFYRAAELALENGFDGFELVSRTHPNTAGAGAQPLRALIQAASQAPMMVPRGDNRWLLQGDIRGLRGPVSADPPLVFDARRLRAILREYVIDPKCIEGDRVCRVTRGYLLVP